MQASTRPGELTKKATCGKLGNSGDLGGVLRSILVPPLGVSTNRVLVTPRIPIKFLSTCRIYGLQRLQCKKRDSSRRFDAIQPTIASKKRTADTPSVIRRSASRYAAGFFEVF